MEQEYIVPSKSPNDERNYQAIELPNQLKIVFIEDPKAQKAACAISVDVGSLSDGQRSLGIAHFLEHMLFMGSRKFPKFNQYSQFIALNSGYDNAYTSDDETNYQFQISNDKFVEATERICDFFVKALLTSSCIEKERQAVHEECMLRFGEDNSRKWEILKHFASGAYHNHSIGNNNTLSHDKVEEDLRNFYEREYSANRITAVMVSAFSIEEMKDKVLPFFQEIENKKLSKIDYELHFRKENIGKLVKMQSIKDEVLMEFFWVVDSVKPFYKHHPHDYICHVLGHQGKNSLLSILKEKDWANEIVSYSHDLPRQTIVGLQLHLTETGEENYEKVYNIVIDYVSQLKAEKFIYEELSQTSAISFKFKEKIGNFQYVTKISSDMHDKPLEQLLTWRSFYEQYQGDIIEKFLRQLVSENLVVVYSCAEELENPIVEKHLGGKFIVEDLPKRKTVFKNFGEPVKNPFLPLGTDLIKDTIKVPVKEDNLWFVQGDFNVCKGGVMIKICKAESEIFLEFYANYLDLLLKELTYQAECLKLSIDIQADDEFSINIYGFSQTVEKLIEEISPIIANVHRSPQGQKLFKLAHENLKEEYQNFYSGEVDQIAETILEIAVKSTGMTIQMRQKELESYRYKKVCQKIDEFWKTAQLQWVVVGNFNKEKMKNLIKNFEKSIGTDASSQKMKIECIKLKKDNPIKTITHLTAQDINTSAVIKYKQIGQYSELKFYTLSLLENYISTPFFDALRTEKQLAYYLSARKRNIRGVLSLKFILVSSNTNPYDISNHIVNFVEEFIKKSDEDLTEDKFQTLKKSLTSKILEPFHNLQDYFSFICREISKGTFCFDRKTNAQKLKNYLSQIKREDLMAMLKECLQYSLDIWVVTQGHRKEFLEKGEIKDVKQIQNIHKQHEYYKDAAHIDQMIAEK